MPDVTQPTSEALSEKELAELNRQVGAIVGFDYDPLRKDILTVGKTKRLLVTLDQALARCERAERQLEAADYVCVIVSDAGFDQHLLDDALKDWGALYYAAQPEPDIGGGVSERPRTR